MNLKSMTQPEIGAVLKELGQPAFRAKQVYTWLHKGVRSYDEMTNLPKGLRDVLSEKYPIHAPKAVRKQESKKDGTIKYLWQLSDGNCVETVLMRYNYGNTVCISTEVGCAMGCAFCASTIGGLVRRLEPFEMLDEVLFTQLDSGLPISRIVLMGIGEPLDNFDNVMRFLELFRNADGSSRILSIWDQTIQTGAPPQDLLYGTEYTREQIQNQSKESVVFQNGSDNRVAKIAPIIRAYFSHGRNCKHCRNCINACRSNYIEETVDLSTYPVRTVRSYESISFLFKNQSL